MQILFLLEDWVLIFFPIKCFAISRKSKDFFFCFDTMFSFILKAARSMRTGSGFRNKRGGGFARGRCVVQ